MNPVKVEEAKKLKECLPAERFPEGNWGTNLVDYEVSLQFEKSTFTNQAPIMATVLIRNTLDTSISNTMSGYLREGVTGHGPVLLTTWKSGQAIPNTGFSSQDMPPSGIHNLVPGTQHKYILPLDVQSKLTNGTYFVRASVMAYVVRWILADGTNTTILQPQYPVQNDLLNAKGIGEWIEVKSANVPIEITGAP